MPRATGLLLGTVLAVAQPASAQSLAERVAAAGDGVMTFAFAARPEVCGDGDRAIRIGGTYRTHHGYGGGSRPCVHGPVQVRLAVREGRVARVESSVGGERPRDGRALGPVPAVEAARYLLDVAVRERGSVGARAVGAAVLADSAVVWPTLLVIARDSTAGMRGARGEAAFWLSRFATAAIGGHPATLGDDAEAADEVKLHAVFVLSQLPNREGIAPLLGVVRSRAELAVRQRALFWLGQSGDPRAIALFESLLRG
jgi:PBS lyase HEAT-like repeat